MGEPGGEGGEGLVWEQFGEDGEDCAGVWGWGGGEFGGEEEDDWGGGQVRGVGGVGWGLYAHVAGGICDLE